MKLVTKAGPLALALPSKVLSAFQQPRQQIRRLFLWYRYLWLRLRFRLRR